MWYWGILPFIVNLISKACQKLFNIGGPVGLGAAANIFVGQVEAPLLVRPYVSKLSNKELLILMTAGMATVAGSVMVALISILENAFINENLIQHFITASVLSVPAAIVTGLFDFFGRSFFSWALCLPLAFPIYIYAFIFVGFFESVPSLHDFLRGNIWVSAIIISMGLFSRF